MSADLSTERAVSTLRAMSRFQRPFSSSADPAVRRRRFAYPLVTLCVTGVIWLLSTGRISMEPSVEPAVYEAFVRSVVDAARDGEGPLAAPDDLMATSWRTIAPEALQDRSGGPFEVDFIQPADRSLVVARESLAGQPVDVRLGNGSGVIVYVRFLDGAARVVGIGARQRSEEDSMSGEPS
jgi:hypothetical protein